MAKPAKVSTPAEASTFAIRFGNAPPAIERKIGGEPSPYAAAMRSMPAPQGDKFASFFVPGAKPADTITDPSEREKASRDNVRKLSNTLSGLARRIAKQDNTKTFAIRTAEENGTLGVCVYRIAAPPVAVAPAT
jgi:hypothetical protein